MSSGIKDRVVALTVGSSGSGRATAASFVTEGASVVIGDIDEAAGRQLVVELSPRTFRRGDVTRGEDIAGLIESAVGLFGRLDVMSNKPVRPGTGAASLTSMPWGSTRRSRCFSGRSCSATTTPAGDA